MYAAIASSIFIIKTLIFRTCTLRERSPVQSPHMPDCPFRNEALPHSSLFVILPDLPEKILPYLQIRQFSHRDPEFKALVQVIRQPSKIILLVTKFKLTFSMHNARIRALRC